MPPIRAEPSVEGVMGAAHGLDLTCPACGAVRVAAHTAGLHRNRHDGFCLLQAPCPGCGELIATAEPLALRQATDAGVRCWELLPPAPPFTDDDVAHLRAALDAGWTWEGDPADPASADQPDPTTTDHRTELT